MIAKNKQQANSHRAANQNQIPEDDSDMIGGRGWHGNSEGHAAAGKKGGETVAKDKKHMAEIGRKGGQAVSQDRNHMAEIGRRGGKSRSPQSANSAHKQA